MQQLCVNTMIEKELEGWPDADKILVKKFCFHQIIPGSDSERALTFHFKFGVFAHHPLSSEDRLGNPDIPFPIGIVYGEQDYFGSDGADFIIRNNKFFAEGSS